MLTLVAIIGLIGAALWQVRTADAHRPGLHAAGTLEAPRLHWLVSARQETNRIARQKCIPRPYRAVRPAQRVPEFARQFTIVVELARQAAYRLRDAECLPTSPEGIIRYVFPSSTEDAAVSVARCESRLYPYAKNPVSSASGLFQLLSFHWAGRFNPFDPWANTRYALRLSKGGTDWDPWVCKP